MDRLSKNGLEGLIEPPTLSADELAEAMAEEHTERWDSYVRFTATDATGRPSGCTPGYCKLRCPRTSAQLSFLCSDPHSLLLLPLEFALMRSDGGQITTRASCRRRGRTC